MAGTPDKKDELEGTEAPFVSHLTELRDDPVHGKNAIGNDEFPTFYIFNSIQFFLQILHATIIISNSQW